jgi:hypothetical protein
MLGSPAGDVVAHGTAAATDPRPMLIESQSQGILNPAVPGTAAHSTTEIICHPRAR